MHNNFYHDDSNRSLTSKALNIKVFVLIFVLHSMSNNANYVKWSIHAYISELSKIVLATFL